MRRRITIGLVLLLVALLPMSDAFAQQTTASLTGQVTGPDGTPLPGANVVAVHEPTGTQYGAATNENGRYTLLNMRVGGPYTVEASFVGYQTEEETDLTLQLGQRRTLDFTLQETAQELEEVEVIAQQDAILNSERTGASTNISEEDIDNNPTINRSISDLVRLTPQSTSGNSLAGRNNRYNNIQVDGATLNDLFGLGEAIPGSQAGAEPISLAAIQEFNVDIAPFSVTNNGFTGGQVNAITRSGTNQFEGQVYFEGRNQALVGTLPVPNGPDAEFPEFDEYFTGFRLGGPIIEDELFFFVNGELKRESSPLTTGTQGSGAPNTFPVGASTLQTIANVAQNQYSYDPGGFGIINQRQDNNKFLAKLDWNVNDEHRLTLRHNYVDAEDGDGIDRGEETFSFTNREFIFNSTQNSTVAELRSTLGSNVYNEARLVYTRIRDERSLQSRPFPDVQLEEVAGQDASVLLGTDRFSQANRLDQDLFEITNNLTYIAGDHEITVGTSNQIFTFENLFIQDFYGNWVFAPYNEVNAQGDTVEVSAVEAFERGVPTTYRYSYSLIDDERPVVEFSGYQIGFYAQDRWTVRPHLNVTAGLRVDVPFITDEPLSNPAAQEAFGRSTTTIASGNLLWAPRLAFNWDASGGERTTQVRGGVGMFSGPPPLVWISNQFSNTGALFGRVDASLSDIDDDGLVDPESMPAFTPDPDDQPRPGDNPNLSPVETSEINLITDDFKYPQTLRTNLAIDQQLPFGFVGTLEGIYSNTINDVVYENINLAQQGTSQIGRPLYGTPRTFGSTPNRVSENFTNALLLKNTNEGYEWSLTAQLQNAVPLGPGTLRGDAAYTHNRAQNVNNGTSSRAISNWQFNENFDVNDPRIGTADFEIRHRLMTNLSYRFQLPAIGANTTVSLFYEGRSGEPFSWIYFGDANADTESFNDLVYIPTGADDPNVVLTSDNWDALNRFIESEPSLADNRGEVARRNSARAPWRNILDLRLIQQIPSAGYGRLEVTADVLNVLNLLHPDWGQIQFTSFNNVNFLGFEGYDAQGRTLISFSESNFFDEDGSVNRDQLFQTSDLASRWQIQLGVRYTF